LTLLLRLARRGDGGEGRRGPAARRQTRIAAPARGARTPRRRSRLRRRPRPRPPVVAHVVAPEIRLGRVAGAVGHEEAEAVVLGKELVAVRFEVDLGDEPPCDLVADADQAPD